MSARVSETFIDAEKLEKLLNAVRPAMPNGVELNATCRGDWLDLHLVYDGARLSRINAFCLRQFWRPQLIDKTDALAEMTRVLNELERSARSVARKLMRLRTLDALEEQYRKRGVCLHFGSGGYVCAVCGETIPKTGFERTR